MPTALAGKVGSSFSIVRALKLGNMIF